VGTPAGLADGDADTGTVAVPADTVGWLTAVALAVADGVLLADGGIDDEQPAAAARQISPMAAPAPAAG
jgi:hypothetical protein